MQHEASGLMEARGGGGDGGGEGGGEGGGDGGGDGGGEGGGEGGGGDGGGDGGTSVSRDRNVLVSSGCKGSLFDNLGKDRGAGPDDIGGCGGLGWNCSAGANGLRGGSLRWNQIAAPSRQQQTNVAVTFTLDIGLSIAMSRRCPGARELSKATRDGASTGKGGGFQGGW